MQELWHNQSGRLFLWVPFLMAFGAGLYFNLSFEPNVFLCICCALIAICFAVYKAPIFIRAISLFVFGFCYGQPVIGELHFAAQYVVVGDDAFRLHAADVLKPALRFFDIAVQYQSLFVKAE